MSTNTFPLTGPIDVSCRFGTGTLLVRADDDRQDAVVTAHARVEGSDVLDRLVVELRGNTLHVELDGQRGSLLESVRRLHSGDREAVDLEIAVPSGTDLKVRVGSASVTTRGRLGRADIGSGSSPVELDHVDGTLRVRGGSGDLELGLVTGVASLRGGSGRIRVRESGERLDATLGSGDFTIGVAHAEVRLRSGSGNMSIGVAEGDLDLVTGSGALMIGLRPGQQARLDAQTGSGRLRTEMPVDDEPTADEPAVGKPITIRARTGSGDVTVRRAEVAVSQD